MGVKLTKIQCGLCQRRAPIDYDDVERGVYAIPEQPSPVSVIGDVMAQSAVSAEIDQILLEEKREEQGRLKILLLGGSDAGKSTILKQMRILHMNGFSKDEIHSFQKYLRHNVYQICHEIAKGVQELIHATKDAEKSLISRFEDGQPWFDGLGDAMKTVFRINFLELEYVPTPEDILHLRIPTTTVNEINFSFDKATIRLIDTECYKYISVQPLRSKTFDYTAIAHRLIDVGGQRSYRKKWIHYFDGAVLFRETGIMPFQALEAHETIKPILHEDIIAHAIVKPQKRQNRLRESAVLFGEMLRCKFLLTAAFILFLNKKDLFVKKLSSRPLCRFIGGYKGTTTEQASDFLKEYFLKGERKDLFSILHRMQIAPFLAQGREKAVAVAQGMRSLCKD